jgi:hypothetical protein
LRRSQNANTISKSPPGVAELFQEKRLDALLRPIVDRNAARNALFMKSNESSLVSRGLSTSLETYSYYKEEHTV